MSLLFEYERLRRPNHIKCACSHRVSIYVCVVGWRCRWRKILKRYTYGRIEAIKDTYMIWPYIIYFKLMMMMEKCWLTFFKTNIHNIKLVIDFHDFSIAYIYGRPYISAQWRTISHKVLHIHIQKLHLTKWPIYHSIFAC